MKHIKWNKQRVLTNWQFAMQTSNGCGSKCSEFLIWKESNIFHGTIVEKPNIPYLPWSCAKPFDGKFSAVVSP